MSGSETQRQEGENLNYERFRVEVGTNVCYINNCDVALSGFQLCSAILHCINKKIMIKCSSLEKEDNLVVLR